MSLRGSGAVAIWHDLLPTALDEFYAWHAREHMPERVAIPGFLRGRRYIVTGAGPEFFNLYEAETAAVLAGPDYRARLDNPTPWTRKVVASFRDVARSTCAVAFSTGNGDGGFVATLRFDATPDDCAALIAQILPPIADIAGIAGVHFLIADEATSNLPTRERAARGDATAVPRHIVLIEGVSTELVDRVADTVAAALPGDIDRATYVLQHATSRHG